MSLSESEIKTKDRLERSHQVSELFQEMFNMGFRSVNAVKSIMLIWYPKYTSPEETIRFRAFWNGKPRSQKMLDELKFVVGEIKSIRKTLKK